MTDYWNISIIIICFKPTTCTHAGKSIVTHLIELTNNLVTDLYLKKLY